MRKRTGIVALVLSLFMSAAVLGADNGESTLALPQDCFDAANTAEPCQILYRYAELLGFGNIPDYVGFVESLLAQAKGESPFVPLRETEEVKRFRELMEAGEKLDESETAQFMSRYLQAYAEYRHTVDSLSLQIQDVWFDRLMQLNAQLLPELDEIEAVERSFLQADPRLANVLAELSPLNDGQPILHDGDDLPRVLTWLSTLYGLDDEYVTERVLLDLVTLYQSGGVAFDLPRFDQRPAIGAMVNTPGDESIELTPALRGDIIELQEAQFTNTDNMLQNLHFYEPYRVNNLLSLLAFAEGMETTLARIPYAKSRSLVDSHFHVSRQIYVPLVEGAFKKGEYNSGVIAGIVAQRLGANLPVVGSHLIQLEQVVSGDYVVVELTPLSARIVYVHTSGYAQDVEAD